MIAGLLQASGLIGLIAGGLIVADEGGGLIGLSVSAIYVGLAMESR